MSKLHL